MKVNFKIIAAHEYECDKCATRIHTGSEFYDCRKCDYDLCTDCNATFTKSLVTSMSHKKESPITIVVNGNKCCNVTQQVGTIVIWLSP